MEKLPSFVLRLSLEEISLRRVVVNLWNETDILASIAKIEYKPMKYEERIKKRYECVEGKISKLVLPEALKEQMMHMVKPIGAEIQQWKMFHEEYLNDFIEVLDVPILEKLCWTSSGTVEYRKTAQELIRCEMVDIVKRYKLACLYCLEDSIALLWAELPTECKRCFYDEDISRVRDLQLEFYWPYILERRESSLAYIREGEFVSFDQHAFERSAQKGMKVANEYFFKKLSNEERTFSLSRTVCAVLESRKRKPSERKLSGVFFYLFSMMTPREQTQVLKQYPCEVLRCFLDWPLQDFLKDVTDLILAFLPESRYGYVLPVIASYVRGGGFRFPSLFKKIFVRSPSDCRKEFVDRECESCSFFPELFRVEDTQTIQVIMRNVDREDRMRLVSCYQFFQILGALVMEGDWHLVELCIQEATPTKGERERVKEAFMGFLTGFNTRDMRRRKRTWKCFFRCLDGTGRSSPHKRSSEDEFSKAKKLCREENVLPRN